MIKIYIAVITSILITSLSAFGLHTLVTNHEKASFEKQLEDQKTALTASCNKAQVLTEKVSNDYQKKISDLAGQLNAAERLYNNSCLPVKSNATIGHAGTAGANQSIPARAGLDNTVSASELLKLLAEGEHYRLQLIECQEFVRGND